MNPAHAHQYPTSKPKSAKPHTTLYSPKTYPDTEICRAPQDSSPQWGLRSLICYTYLQRRVSGSASKYLARNPRRGTATRRGRGLLDQCHRIASGELRWTGLLLGTSGIGLWRLCFWWSLWISVVIALWSFKCQMSSWWSYRVYFKSCSLASSGFFEVNALKEKGAYALIVGTVRPVHRPGFRQLLPVRTSRTSGKCYLLDFYQIQSGQWFVEA